MQLPPLQTVRAFEAAARLGSFARAADELALTASAVSHHMKGLESRLHAKLFVRAGRGVELTETGHALHAKLALGLALIEQAFAEAHQRKRWRTLTVSVLPAFGTAPNASATPVLFGDLTYGYLGLRSEIDGQTSRDAYFTTDEIGLRALERFDVNLMANAAMAVLQLAAS